MWNKKHSSLFHKCSLLDIKQTIKNVAYTTFKYLEWARLSINCEKRHNPIGIYLLKVNNRNTRARCEICSKLRNVHVNRVTRARKFVHGIDWEQYLSLLHPYLKFQVCLIDLSQSDIQILYGFQMDNGIR